jgi:signal transduction histidine kinase
MSGQYTNSPYLLLQFLTALFLLILSAYSFRRRSVPGALPFGFASLFAALWVVGSFMEYVVPDPDAKIFWVKVQGAMQLPTITAHACFVLEYALPGRWLTRRNLILLSFPPLLFLLLAISNDFHHLMWTGFTIDGIVIPQRNTVLYAFIAYGVGLGLVEIMVFAWLFWRSPPHRWPVAIMVSAQTVARAFYLLDIASVIQTKVPVDVLIIAFLFVAYGIALFAFQLLDPIPLASQTVIEQLQEGVIILDPGGQLAKLNKAAQTILNMPPNHSLGCPIRELLPDYDCQENGPSEFSLKVGSESRDFELENTALKDWRGIEVGRLLLMRDVTEQRRVQAKIIEQERALAMLQERDQLARELHDSTGQVLGYVSLQTQAVLKYVHDGNLASAESQLSRLAEAASAAHLDVRESILSLKAGSGMKLPFIAALKEYLHAYSDNYGIHAELVSPETLPEIDFAPQINAQLLRVIGEAITNARKHSGAACVRISLLREYQQTKIIITDDGKGFDIRQRANGQRHFGLTFMRERMAQVGGDLQIESELGKGTSVLLRLPASS